VTGKATTAWKSAEDVIEIEEDESGGDAYRDADEHQERVELENDTIDTFGR
jgi:hypothetical protein